MAKRTKRRANQRGGMQSLDDLLVHSLGDLLTAEKHFLKAQQSMVKEISNTEIKDRVEQHIRESEGHVQRIGDAFRSIEQRQKAEKCRGAEGIVEEYRSFKTEERPSKHLLDVFDVASELRAEHYEIAAYRSAIAMSEALGQRDVADLLHQNLREEEDMAYFLETKAATAIQGAMASRSLPEKTTALGVH